MLHTKCIMSELILHTNIRLFLSELMVHTKMCYVRTYAMNEYEMFSVRTYVTYENIMCPKLCYTRIMLHTKMFNVLSVLLFQNLDLGIASVDDKLHLAIPLSRSCHTNVYAKFYQHIPKDSKEGQFHLFQNLNLGKASTYGKCHLTIP